MDVTSDETVDEYAMERAWARLHDGIKTPTLEQLRCLRLVDVWLEGLHHAPRTIRACSVSGIELVFHRGKHFASFDFGDLTRLVFAAHDHCVRAEVGTAGMHITVMLHARARNEGATYQRHPTLEQAVASWRNVSGVTYFVGNNPLLQQEDTIDSLVQAIAKEGIDHGVAERLIADLGSGWEPTRSAGSWPVTNEMRHRIATWIRRERAAMGIPVDGQVVPGTEAAGG